VTTLDSGLRVVTDERPGQVASVGVFVRGGSRTEARPGVAHFMEHLIFKGTQRRTREQIEKEAENMGAHFNAFTSRETIAYLARSHKADAKRCFDMMADILQNSKFAEENIEVERGVILSEYEDVDKQPREVVMEKLHAAAFRDQPLANEILGTEDDIRSITRDDVLEFYRSHYVAPNMVVVASGDVKHDEVVSWSADAFKSLPTEPAVQPRPNLPARFVGSDIRMRYDSMDRAHIAFGFPIPGCGDYSYVPFTLMQTLLGAHTPNSPLNETQPFRLGRKIADEKLADEMSTFITPYSDVSLFGVYLNAPAVGLQDLMWHVTDEITRLSYEVHPALLNAAKNNLIAGILARQQGAQQIVEEIGQQMLNYGRVVHPLEMVERIEEVDEALIKRLAREHLNDRDHVLAARGPIYELPDYNWLRRRSYWLRF
jgi:processing peptidase subunit beta